MIRTSGNTAREGLLMQEPLELPTERVVQSAEGLKRHYGARRLHILRVGIRRIRTYLKHSGDHRAQGMRKIWGGFAGATNDARDWDVFHRTARALLVTDEYQSFRRLNRKRLEASHRTVKALVNSGQWYRHLEEWRRYLERFASHAGTNNRERPSLDAALRKAGVNLSRALQSDDDRAWHNFRISVKETRYIADAVSPLPVEVRQVIAACKSLQATLGEWHDTVIQLQLLEELEPDPVHVRLHSQIRKRKTSSLSQTRTLLAAQSVFSPARDDDGSGAAGV
jgi:CHAD domain-containing protein